MPSIRPCDATPFGLYLTGPRGATMTREGDQFVFQGWFRATIRCHIYNPFALTFWRWYKEQRRIRTTEISPSTSWPLSDNGYIALVHRAGNASF